MDPDWRPRLRGAVLAFHDERSVRFVDLGALTVKDFAVEEWVARLIGLLDGKATVGSIITALGDAASADDIIQCIQVMADERLLIHRGAVAPADGPYMRQIDYFDEVLSRLPEQWTTGVEMQEAVLSSCAVVIGCGGMGTHVLDALARAGVGSIEIFDPDIVEESNLHRQVLYTRADLHRPKVHAAAERLTQISPSTEVRAHRERFDRDSGTASERIDLVINCADEPDILEISDTVAEWALNRRIPHIVGGAYGANLGMLPVSVLPGASVCWRCVRAATEALAPGAGMTAIRGRAASTGTVGPITGLVANFVALDALRILAGLSPTLVDAVRELDLSGGGWRTLDVRPRPDCASCRTVA